jgi:hypothetical protein
MSTAIRPITEITHEAITLLTREMGVADTLRFLNQFNTGMGNYTEERDALIGDLTLDEIFARGRRLRSSQSGIEPDSA